jgi:hypothetical protein
MRARSLAPLVKARGIGMTRRGIAARINVAKHLLRDITSAFNIQALSLFP